MQRGIESIILIQEAIEFIPGIMEVLVAALKRGAFILKIRPDQAAETIYNRIQFCNSIEESK